ncbi:Transcription elongation factor spt6 [Chytridiales sp. JEL 0842]|nr:Transcription elongation factor spt6 [Chytridiales sp. JEL 0842]
MSSGDESETRVGRDNGNDSGEEEETIVRRRRIAADDDDVDDDDVNGNDGNEDNVSANEDGEGAEDIISAMRKKNKLKKKKSKKHRGSDGEGDDREQRKKKKKKKIRVDEDEDEEGGDGEEREKKKKKTKLSDEDGSEGGSQGSDDDESEREVDSSEDDESDEEMTEADKQFIVDDEEVVDDDGEGGPQALEAERRRKKKRRREREEEEDLDEDDLDLIDENLGRAPRKDRLKRLRKIADDRAEEEARKSKKDLSGIFEEDDGVSEGEIEEKDSVRKRLEDDERELMSSEDELDNFIEDDEEEGLNEEESKQRRLEKRRARKANLAQNYGVSDDVWHDIQDLFGDGSDYAYAMKTNDEDDAAVVPMDEDYEGIRDSPKKKAIKITDIYEPSEIAARMLTEEDEAIKIRDAPERIQIRGEVQPLSDEDQRREVEFILRRLMIIHKEQRGIHITADYRDAVSRRISTILGFFHNHNFEVPFIMAHRKDHFDGFLDRTDLWKIYDLDVLFRTLDSKKQNIRGLVNELRKQSDGAVVNRYLDDCLDRARTLEDVGDVMVYMQLHYTTELQRAEEARNRALKRTVKRTVYEDARKAGLGNYVKLFNIDVKAVTECLVTHSSDFVPEDAQEMPDEAAITFLQDRGLYSTTERVMEGGRMMLAYELASDPRFRQFIRKVYETDAVVTVTPTEKGKREIQPLHPYYPFKYLSEKPVVKFFDGQFLNIRKAEDEGLVDISIRVEEEARLVEDVVKHMTNDYVNEYAEAWNAERKKAAEYATRNILFPQICKWLKEKLANDASDWIVDQCRLAMEKKLNKASYKRDRSNDDGSDDEDEKSRDYARVMSISWGEGNRDSATIVICLDEDGNVASRMKLSRMQERDTDGKIRDVNNLLDRIRRFRPDVIVVGGFSTATSRRLIPDITELLSRINEKSGRDDDSDDNSYHARRKRGYSSQIPKPGLIMVEDDVARIAMKSARLQKEFPDFPPLGLYCVSLARTVQDTTMEYATLFSSDDEMKLLHLHPLQHLLPDEKYKSAIERAFINIGKKLESRADLVTKKIVAFKVFMNCASFIRIKEKHFPRRNLMESMYDVLDDTRIHPEDYDLARKMAADALDVEGVTDEDPSQHVAELMEDRPERLNLLMLDDYAEVLEKQLNEPKRITLNEIKDEIMHPYKERRERFQGATYTDIFHMVTGETDETLRPGMVISCEVSKIMDRFVRVRLANGLDGTIHSSKFPGSSNARPDEIFRENTYIQAAVSKVDTERLLVELDAREEVVNKDWAKDVALSTRDRYFSEVREEDDRERKPLIPRVVKPKQVRLVQHPYWKNVTYQEAIEQLSPSDVRRGTIIIRPSTKGNNHLSITWKIEQDIFQHIDIVESQKENEWSVGRVLTIDGKNYDDLDEIIAMYIEPIAQNFNDAMSHSKFRRMPRSDMYRWIENQCTSQKRSVYGIIICQEKPGTLYLVYQHPGNRVKHEYMTVTPDGFGFRGTVFKKLDQAFDAFKKMEAKKVKEALKAKEAARRGEPSSSSSRSGPPPSSSGMRGGGSSASSYGPSSSSNRNSRGPPPPPMSSGGSGGYNSGPSRNGGAPGYMPYPNTRPVMAQVPPPPMPSMIYGQPPPSAPMGQW